MPPARAMTRGFCCLVTGSGTCDTALPVVTGAMGCMGARGWTPVAPYGPRGCTGAGITGCCGTVAFCCALLPVFAVWGFAGVAELGAAGLGAMGEFFRLPCLGLLRAAISVLARRSCSACVAIAAHTLSLTSFHNASCSSVLANSSMRTGAT